MVNINISATSKQTQEQSLILPEPDSNCLPWSEQLSPISKYVCWVGAECEVSNVQAEEHLQQVEEDDAHRSHLHC